MLTFGELFAGIGGFSLGLERAGMQCRWQVEIDNYARRVLQKHWPDVRRHDDVQTFPPAGGDYSVDVICGGFPCQDISVAGKGAGLAGARSGLWYEFSRIIDELRPRYVIVENVAALLSRGMDTVLSDLSTLRYDAEWHVIPASAVGAPHRRDRVWIVAYAISEPDAVRRDGEAMPPALACGRCDARGSVSDCGAGCSQEPGQGASDVGNANSELLEGQRKTWVKGPRSRCQKRKPKRPSSDFAGWWATEPAVGRVANGIPCRVDRLRCLGNAVVPQVVELIGRAIMEREHGNPQQ